MEQVIAKKKSSLMASYIVLIVLGAIISIFGVSALILAPNKYLGAGLLAFGLIVLGAGLAWTIVFARFPKAYVTFKEGKLYLSKGGVVCSPSEVDYCRSSSYGLDGAIFNYGKLIVSVGHQEYKFWFVQNVSKAVSIINDLKAQATAIENAQKEIAARKATESTETEQK
ncbi:MAG: hypothetical protein K2K60_02240 [Clostridia bacterium]|nr:hypothetical protein [Clostridia bacterium]